jgi:hypothetical protein
VGAVVVVVGDVLTEQPTKMALAHYNNVVE